MTPNPRESDIEADLVAVVQKRGGHAYKFTSPGRRNVPDRLCVIPGCVPFWVEVKRVGKEPTAGQDREAKRLRDCGAYVFLLNHEMVDQLVDHAINLTKIENIVRVAIESLTAKVKERSAAKARPCSYCKGPLAVKSPGVRCPQCNDTGIDLSVGHNTVP